MPASSRLTSLSVRADPSSSARAWGDVGGFGVGSEFTWQAAALVGWGSSRWRIELGYRALAVDLDEDDVETEWLAHGPILGVAVRF